MHPNEIQVGKFYLRVDYPESRWLGCGKRKPFTDGQNMEFTEKYMVCVASELTHGLGLVFMTPDDEYGSCIEEWNLFYIDPWQNP